MNLRFLERICSEEDPKEILQSIKDGIKKSIPIGVAAGLGGIIGLGLYNNTGQYYHYKRLNYPCVPTVIIENKFHHNPGYSSERYIICTNFFGPVPVYKYGNSTSQWTQYHQSQGGEK